MIQKELNYLSLPDHFNKYLLVNFNQRVNSDDSLNFYFSFKSNKHLGSSIKAIIMLELIFPKKSFVSKVIIKKKKTYFGEKKSKPNIFRFCLRMKSDEFVSFYRYFCVSPFSFNKKPIDIPLVSKRLKMFDFFVKMYSIQGNITNSFFFLSNYHLN